VGGSTGKALIHDLDLLVTSPAGRTYYANGGNTIDTVNNVELIVVPGPAKGAWKVGNLPTYLSIVSSQRRTVLSFLCCRCWSRAR
jgi:hypothetical protein